MEKYAVVQDLELTKTAGAKSTCPKCGAQLVQNEGLSTTILCPNCGSEPWEKSPKTSEK